MIPGARLEIPGIRNTRPTTSFKSTAADKEKIRRFEPIPNQASLIALLEDPRDPHHHMLNVIGGADVRVLTGRATKFSRFGIAGRTVSGTVVTVNDGKPLSSGRVLIRVGAGVLRPRFRRLLQQSDYAAEDFYRRQGLAITPDAAPPPDSPRRPGERG